MWEYVIELGNMTETIVYGEPIKAMTYREVFANLKDDNRAEHYNAAIAGLKPELTFEIHDFEFNNDEYVKYKNKEYAIMRAPKIGEKRELVITARVGSEV